MIQRKRHPRWLFSLAAVAGAMVVSVAPAQEDGPTPGTIEPAQAAPQQEVSAQARLHAARQELETVVDEAGLLRQGDAQDRVARLEKLTELGRSLQGQVTADDQLALADLDLRANYALAQHARATGHEREAGYRVGRLRTLAMSTRNLSAPGAALLGDFWLLQADLFDLNNAGLDLDARQRETIRRLEQFVTTHGPLLTEADPEAEPADGKADSDLLTEPAEDVPPAALAGTPPPAPPPPPPAEQATPDQQDNAGDAKERRRAQLKDLVESMILEQRTPATAGSRPQPQPQPDQPVAQPATPVVSVVPSFRFDTATQRALITDVHLALLRLYDERGLSDRVGPLVDTLRQTAQRQGNPALLTELDRWFGYRQTLGRIFAARVPTADGETWSSEDHRGKVIVLHFWANWYEPSVEGFQALAALQREVGEANLAILSIDMGGTAQAATSPTVNWPITRDAAMRQQLAELLAVHTLPRYIVLDRAGRVARVGSGVATVAEYLRSEAARPSGAAESPAQKQP